MICGGARMRTDFMMQPWACARGQADGNALMLHVKRCAVKKYAKFSRCNISIVHCEHPNDVAALSLASHPVERPSDEDYLVPYPRQRDSEQEIGFDGEAG
jgi:hypothetical protein